MRYVEQRLLEVSLTENSRRPARQPLVRPPKEPRKRKIEIEIRPYDGTKEWQREYNALRRQTSTGRAATAKSNLRQLHGISLEQYNELWDRQHGLCAICKCQMVRSFDPDAPTGSRGPKKNGAHVDHDHGCCPGRRSCGRCIRGLLCPACNVGLSCFRDKPDLLMAAAHYAALRT